MAWGWTPSHRCPGHTGSKYLDTITRSGASGTSVDPGGTSLACMLTLKAPTVWVIGLPPPAPHSVTLSSTGQAVGYGFARPDQPWLLLPQHPDPLSTSFSSLPTPYPWHPLLLSLVRASLGKQVTGRCTGCCCSWPTTLHSSR